MQWAMGYGLWAMGHGLWALGHGPWPMGMHVAMGMFECMRSAAVIEVMYNGL